MLENPAAVKGGDRRGWRRGDLVGLAAPHFALDQTGLLDYKASFPTVRARGRGSFFEDREENRYMPNVKSAKKRVKTNERDRVRNRDVKGALRTAMKKANVAIAAGDVEGIGKTVPAALSLIGRGAKKGVIHKNKAARLESRMTRKAKAAQATPK